MYLELWCGQKSIHAAFDIMAYKRYFPWVMESLLNKQLEKSKCYFCLFSQDSFVQIKGQFISSNLFVDIGY